MRFRVLGPLRVHKGSTWVPVPADQQRIVLAVLLTEPGRVVATPRLVDEVWGDRPPRTAVNTVHAYVMRLRRLLGDGVLLTRPHGYELTLGPDDLDAVLFERLVTAGRAALADGRPDEAADRLSEALDLWRGPALADVPETRALSAWAFQADQTRLAAIEDRMAALLALGRHAETVDELSRLVDEHPLREQFTAHLMLALHRCGRRGEALDAYRRTRQVLLAELGLEPGHELRAIQTMVLADDRAVATSDTPTRSVIPAQLPAGVPGFTGRAEQLKQLDDLSADADDPNGSAVLISTIAGTAGVGKTALAIHWGHRVRDRFADGQLYVDLRGFSDGQPVSPLQALGGFLRALGVPHEQIPSDVDEASALYRSLVAGRRILVLLDNAGQSEQIRPLLPGTPGCMAVVTSRDRLASLIARDGAALLTLDVLTPDEALALLARTLGADRVEAELAAATELARLCGQLPLALRIAAANLTTRARDGIAAYVARLAGDRLGGLEVDGDPQVGVRAALDLSYAALSDSARRLFRLLGLLPGPDVVASVASALTGAEPRTVVPLLDRLVAAHLVDEHGPGRYVLHDLVRSYAAERAVVEEGEAARRSALARVYRHYLRHVDAAARVLYPEFVRLPHTDENPVRFHDIGDAATWVDEERANLVAVVTYAAEHGPYEAAWRLADALRGYLFSHASTVERQTVARAGLAAAEADGDQQAVAAGHLGIAVLHTARGAHTDAIHAYARAAGHARRAGWLAGEAAALGNMGAEYQVLGRLEPAARYLTRSLAIRRGMGWPAGEAGALSNIGLVYWGMGRLEQAAECCLGAAAIFRDLDAELALAKVNSDLGVIYHALGRLDDASATLTSALTTLDKAGHYYYLGVAQAYLAELHRDRGELSTALDLIESARLVASEIGDRWQESFILSVRGNIQHDLGRYAEAIDCHQHALTLNQEVGDIHLNGDLTVRLARAYRGAGHLDLALDLAQQALDTARAGGYRMLEGTALTVLAEVHWDAGRREVAVDLAWQAVIRHVETGHRLGQERAQSIVDRAALPDGPG